MLNDQSLQESDRVRFEPLETGVLCGTDFSEGSKRAADVAAVLAKCAGEKLVLVHAVNERSQEHLPGDLRESLALYARAELREERQRVQAIGLDQEEVFQPGKPVEVLLDQARVHSARLIVLAAPGQGQPRRWLHRSVAARVAEASVVPVLLVRDARPFHRWAGGERRLRVVVASDWLNDSESTLDWAQWLKGLGACEVIVVYFEPRILAHLSNDAFSSTLRTDVVKGCVVGHARQFRRRVRELLGNSGVRIRFERGWGISDAHLIQLASEEQADLIVVGNAKGWPAAHASLGRGVMHYAPVNVACIPESAAHTHPTSKPKGTAT